MWDRVRGEEDEGRSAPRRPGEQDPKLGLLERSSAHLCGWRELAQLEVATDLCEWRRGDREIPKEYALVRNRAPEHEREQRSVDQIHQKKQRQMLKKEDLLMPPDLRRLQRRVLGGLFSGRQH